MKILFVYPQYPETFWSFKHVMKFISRKAVFPPLGLMTVSSMLPKDFQKKLIDLNVEPLKDNDIEWADYVFMSAMIVQKESVKQIIKQVKALGKKIVAGGPLFVSENETEFPEIDHFVLNEGEVTVPEFLADLKQRKAKKFYRTDIKPDISKSPVPDWSLIKMKKYATMLVQYSRGCPFDCDFCDITFLNGRVPRTKRPEQVVRELNTLYKSGWRGSVFFVDDNFIGNKFLVKKTLNHVIDWMKSKKYPFNFFTEASLDLASDQELMDLMVKAGFNTVFLGIETPEEESLVECNKFQNTSTDLVESVKTLQRNGLQVQGGFIVGFDNDPHNIFEKQIEFIQKIGVVTAMVGLLNAIPGTRLYHRLKKEGRILKHSTGDNTDGSINFIPKMDTKKLIEGYKNILKTIYSPKEYYERILTFLETYKPKSRSRIVKFNEINAFIKSIWKLGIVGKARRYYWKIITKTLIKYPKAFPEVVAMLLCGFHFQQILLTI
jgi:radical SAM superfamily enzyme YgiQ (UPF0313 family)